MNLYKQDYSLRNGDHPTQPILQLKWLGMANVIAAGSIDGHVYVYQIVDQDKSIQKVWEKYMGSHVITI